MVSISIRCNCVLSRLGAPHFRDSRVAGQSLFRMGDLAVISAAEVAVLTFSLLLFGLEQRPVAFLFIVSHRQERDDDHHPVEVVRDN